MNESLDKLHSFQKQPEALRLADILDREWANDALTYDTALDASAELRRLHAVNQELLEALQVLCDYAETSDDCQYGTLSTKFVRDVALPAITKATGGAV